jgi:hypothetical protein
MMRETRILLLSVALCLLMPVASTPQDTAKKSPETPSPRSSASTEKKPALAEVTRVSTDEATRSAAKKQAKKTAEEEVAEKPSDPDVVELRPAPASAESSGGAVVVPSKKSKKSVLGNVHGTVHGSADARNSGTRRTGASVGASSKSGKTAVYVETERGRTQPNPPR